MIRKSQWKKNKGILRDCKQSLMWVLPPTLYAYVAMYKTGNYIVYPPKYSNWARNTSREREEKKVCMKVTNERQKIRRERKQED